MISVSVTELRSGAFVAACDRPPPPINRCISLANPVYRHHRDALDPTGTPSIATELYVSPMSCFSCACARIA